MGFFRSIGTGWRFIKQAFKMAGENRALLKPSMYSVVFSILYFLVWVGILVAIDIDFEKNAGLGALIGGCATFGSFLIFYFFCGMTVNMVDVHLAGGEPSVKEAYRDAKQNFVAICWMAFVSTIVNMLANAIRGDNEGGGNLVGRIIAGIIERVWTVLTYLMLPAIIIEDCSMREALRRVRDMHKGNVLLIAIGDVGVRAVTGLIGFLVMMLIFGVVWFSIDTIGGTTGVIVAITVGGTILSLFAAFSTFVRMAYYTCLYLWAKKVKAEGRDAPAPLPLARAMKPK